MTAITQINLVIPYPITFLSGIKSSIKTTSIFNLCCIHRPPTPFTHRPSPSSNQTSSRLVLVPLLFRALSIVLIFSLYLLNYNTGSLCVLAHHSLKYLHRYSPPAYFIVCLHLSSNYFYFPNHLYHSPTWLNLPVILHPLVAHWPISPFRLSSLYWLSSLSSLQT